MPPHINKMHYMFLMKLIYKFFWLLCLLALAACGTVSSPSHQTSVDEATANSGRNNKQNHSSVSTAQKQHPYGLIPQGELHPVSPYHTESMSVAHIFINHDLWERIRKGVAMPDLQNDLVRQQEQWYASRPDYIQRMVERSRKYLFHIVEELERRNMPSELALLPYIESAFNPQAVSIAKAAGMWQFMPATGKGFDLKQNAFRDDRRDVLASTRAALDYLQSLYNMFNDWHLALAAYNWGQGNVKRAIERNQRLGKGVGYEDLDMPNETRMYVPKLQAVKNIILQPQQFNVNLPLIENHPFFDTVTLKKDIDIALAAKLAEVSEEDFKALNPSVNKPIIMAAGTPQILLPWDKAAIFQRNVQYHVGPLASWTAWAVPSHMRTSDIAKRFGIQEEDLRQVNRIPPSMLVKAGSTVLVPRTDEHKDNVPEHVADHGAIALQPETRLQKTSIKANKGETLSAVAQRLKISVADLAQWNDLTPQSKLKAGQSLVVLKTVLVRTQSPVMTNRPVAARSITNRKIADAIHKGRTAVTPKKSITVASAPVKSRKK